MELQSWFPQTRFMVKKEKVKHNAKMHQSHNLSSGLVRVMFIKLLFILFDYLLLAVDRVMGKV